MEDSEIIVGNKTLHEWALELKEDLVPEPRMISSYKTLINLINAAREDFLKESIK